MLARILDAHGGTLPDDVHAVFCNTGLEASESLDFVWECGRRWSVPITWLEYDRQTQHQTRIVDFASASRSGEPFAALNGARFMVPNPVARFCTVALKIRRVASFARHHLGWRRWSSVVGIRADEPSRVDRQRARAAMRGDEGAPVLPLADAGATRAVVSAFWAAQPFDLALPSIDGTTLAGNCIFCFLKGRQKIARLIGERPDDVAWWIEQERRFPSTKRPGEHCTFRRDWTYSELKAEVAAAGADEEQDGKTLESIDCACTD